MNYSLSHIAEIVGGTHIGNNVEVSHVCFDSRSVSANSGVVFVALKGERIDGHSFIDSLYQMGIKAFIVDSGFEKSNDLSKYNDCGFVVTFSPLKAIQDLAAYHRTLYKGEVVAICGSNGKTVIKEMIAQLVDERCGKIFRSPKSYNSQIGVALSLLMIDGDEKVVIIEAGISKPHEMERLEEIIKPTTVIVANIGKAHDENFTSEGEKISEKISLCKNCNKIIYRASGIEAKIIEERYSGKLLYKSCKNSLPYPSPFVDEPSNENLAHAITLLNVLDIVPLDLEKKIAQLHRTPMRLELCRGANNSEIINDSYNSDYGSLEVALSYMQTIGSGRKKVVILSDIMQSGKPREELYSQVAELLESSGIEQLIAIGCDLYESRHLFSLKRQEFYLSTSEYLFENRERQFSSSVVLLKGCRAFEFEKILRTIQSKMHNTILEVNLDNMLYNLNYYRSHLDKEVRCMAMVKANSYGSGSYEVARALEKAHIDYLAVAFADEGIELRDGGIKAPIVVLGSDPSSYGAMIEYALEPEIYSFDSLRDFADELERRGVVDYPIHVKLDTGMLRMGFREEQIEQLVEIIKLKRGVKVASIFSHLASSDNQQHDQYTQRQFDRFRDMSTQIKESFDYKIITHICNSAAITRFKCEHNEMVRLGIGLYGFGDENLKPISTLRTIITQIKEVKKGEAVGYNRNQILEKDSTIATVAIGYADGVRRALSCGKWSLEVNGKLAPIVGNICMDTSMIDVTDIDAKVGDYATVFGENRTAKDMATVLGTIEYEVLTSVAPRIKRTYLCM